MKFALKLAAAALAALPMLAGGANARPLAEWAHKDWRAYSFGDSCEIRTGGDGAGVFSITVDRGGYNASATYLPVAFRNMPQPLEFNDGVDLYVDGRDAGFGYETAIFDGTDEWGEYFRGANTYAGVPELLRMLRRGNMLEILVSREGRAPRIYDEFSLSGITANLLKISEWCAFDADNLFQS